MRVEHQLKTFEQILKSYDGLMPLHRFLPGYFKRNKQMGSSDRRWASRYMYSFFRLGKALLNLSGEKRLAVADFLCNSSSSLVIEHTYPELKDFINAPVKEKIALIADKFPNFKLEDVFAFGSSLSDRIDKKAFYASFFRQPDLFIRIDALDQFNVQAKLSASGIDFRQLSDTTLALPNATKLESILEEGSYQVQDYSSQYTGLYFKPNKWDKWWDCCAASGGKSLLLHSLQPEISLLVSDVRESILNNLEERFKLAGLKKYQKKELDLLQNNDLILHHYEFDGIILDAPCTGSGTWGRTPEMLHFFEEQKIMQFSKIQKAIAQNVVKYLKADKPLIYITCSAFKAENEDVVAFMLQNLPLKLEKMEVIEGYLKQADTMFVARLIKV